MIVAWYDLPAETKARIDGRFALHHFATSRNRINPELMTQVEYDELPPGKHIMVRDIPETAKKSLYVGSYAGAIVGTPDDEAKPFIYELISFATVPERVYTHTWRANDVVLWDNRTVVHRGRPFARDKHARVMIRTTIAGDRQAVEA